MSQMQYKQFCLLVADLVDDHGAKAIVDEVRQHHAKELSEITPYIVENAIVNIARNVRRRKVKLVIDGIGDLFADFDIPAKMPRPKSPEGRPNSKLLPSEKFTKAELQLRIQELQDRPVRKNKHLAELQKLYEAIDSFCSDDESIEIGLRRRKESH
jgi:hypothetical protein